MPDERTAQMTSGDSFGGCLGFLTYFLLYPSTTRFLHTMLHTETAVLGLSVGVVDVGNTCLGGAKRAQTTTQARPRPSCESGVGGRPHGAASRGPPVP